MPNDDSWNPAQYDRFKAERQRPFFDLVEMIEARSGMHVVDLGCGTGELTAALHKRLRAAHTLGIDRSAAMLAKASPRGTTDLAFEQRDIGNQLPRAAYELVISNAALHWVPDHEKLLERLTSSLRPEGQLAVQVPANHTEATHRVAAQVAACDPFRSAMDGYVAPVHVLPPPDYARLLHALGYVRQRVELRVYGHILESRDAVVEWVKGTTLTVYRDRLSDQLYEHFLEEYRGRLFDQLADQRPYFFPFSRILMWARR